MKNLVSFRLETLKGFYSRHERYLIPGALLLGFLVDLITFRLINLGTALILLSVYLLVSGIGIIFVNLYDAGFFRTKILTFGRIFVPLIIQYSFGAILSASIIFYSFSGTLFSSWPFISVLIFLFLGNEFFKKYYTNPVFQLSIYFLSIFSFAILSLPYLTHILGPAVFISSGVLSLVFMVVFISVFNKRVPMVQKKIKTISVSIIAVFILMNIFYFTNIIPPFPLSVREIGVYHSLEKTLSNDYQVLGEKKGWLDFFSIYKKFSITSYDKKAIVFSSVFSPAKLNTEIVHEWQYLDPVGKWQTLSQISFPIVGGRKEGYRGYSEKEGLIPGKWRVNVKTKSGQTVGRLYLKIRQTENIPELEEELI